jgi:hypothetical protein
VADVPARDRRNSFASLVKVESPPLPDAHRFSDAPADSTNDAWLSQTVADPWTGHPPHPAPISSFCGIEHCLFFTHAHPVTHQRIDFPEKRGTACLFKEFTGPEI